MARSMHENDIDVYRVKKEADWGTNYEGPYMTKAAAKARMSFNRGYTKLTIQKLDPYYVSVPFVIEGTDEHGYEFESRLAWVDVDG